MKTPYLYEYFSIAEGDGVVPESSVFAGNMSLNRQIGMPCFSASVASRSRELRDRPVQRPAKLVPGLQQLQGLHRNVTTRPWLTSQTFPALHYFNLGGSWDVGYEYNPTPGPNYFETANDETANGNAQSLSPTFLGLNKNVIEQGERVQWGAHAVWFYKSLFLMAEYGGGRAGYSFTGDKYSTPVNYSGWFVQGSYFLTGEELTRRVSVVQPRQNFNFEWFRGGEFRPGAVELQARFATMELGRNIFTGGFADPALYTNHVWVTDMGINWYLNFYVKIMLDWQHSEFGNPVIMGPEQVRLDRRHLLDAVPALLLSISSPLHRSHELVIHVNRIRWDDGMGRESRIVEIGSVAHDRIRSDRRLHDHRV